MGVGSGLYMHVSPKRCKIGGELGRDAGAESEGLMGVPLPTRGEPRLQKKSIFHSKWRVLVHSERTFVYVLARKKC